MPIFKKKLKLLSITFLCLLLSSCKKTNEGNKRQNSNNNLEYINESPIETYGIVGEKDDVHDNFIMYFITKTEFDIDNVYIGYSFQALYAISYYYFDDSIVINEKPIPKNVQNDYKNNYSYKLRFTDDDNNKLIDYEFVDDIKYTKVSYYSDLNGFYPNNYLLYINSNKNNSFYKLSLPKELFTSDEGSLNLAIFRDYLLDEDSEYLLTTAKIYYKVNNDKIILSTKSI